MRIIIIILILQITFILCKAQNILLDEQWEPKINKAISLVKKTDPIIFEIIKSAYIQAGEISCKQMTAFAQIEYRYNKEIPWIMIDREALNEFDYKMIASILIHESWHLKLWYHEGGKNWGNMTEQEQKAEHSFIFNYQIAFLQKVNAPESDIYYYKTLMNQLGIQLNKSK